MRLEIGARKARLTDPSLVKRMRAREEVQAAIDKISRRYGQIEAEEAVRLFNLRDVLLRWAKWQASDVHQVDLHDDTTEGSCRLPLLAP